MSDHVAYLNAKRGLDDRSLDRRVLATFDRALPAKPTILEVGAGTLTMPERLFEWNVVESGTWIALDNHAEAIEAGRRRLTARSDAAVTDDGIQLGALTVQSAVADAFEYAENLDERVDAVVGNAFFDIVEADDAVAAFRPLTDLLYAPITYDGRTAFDPPDPDDERVLDRYEHHMREYRPGGPDGAETLSNALSRVLADEPAPWLIEPPYTEAERTVLSHLLDTIETAVAETGESAETWAERRRQQLAAGELRYEATNRDLLGEP